MQDKPLDRTEHELLAIILELHAARGPIDRNLLSVVARGRGMEVARPLARLKNLGLVEEYERKPFFLKRIFGARPVALLRPLPAAMPVPAEAAPGVALPDADPGRAGFETGAARVPSPQDDIPALPQDAPPLSEPEVFAPAEPGVYVPPVYEAPIYQPPLPETSLPEMPLPEAPITDVPGIAPPYREAPEGEDVAAPHAPEAQTGLDIESDELDMSDFALPLDMPEQPEESAAQSTAAPAAARPARRKVPVGYTDEIGGIAQAFDIAPQMPDLSPELMDGLREVLGGVGMELTMAGEALIGDRMAKGASAGEALSQVVLFAFAHAVRYDAASEGEVKALGLNDYAVEVMRELEKLRDAGEIGEQRFEDDMRHLWRLVEDTPEGTEAAEALLQDPVGGAAPTALLPEDLRQADEG